LIISSDFKIDLSEIEQILNPFLESEMEKAEEANEFVIINVTKEAKCPLDKVKKYANQVSNSAKSAAKKFSNAVKKIIAIGNLDV